MLGVDLTIATFQYELDQELMLADTQHCPPDVSCDPGMDPCFCDYTNINGHCGTSNCPLILCHPNLCNVITRPKTNSVPF